MWTTPDQRDWPGHGEVNVLRAAMTSGPFRVMGPWPRPIGSVAAAGAQVMPFHLEATTHISTDTDTGGIQDIVADDRSDVPQHLPHPPAPGRRGIEIPITYVASDPALVQSHPRLVRGADYRSRRPR